MMTEINKEAVSDGLNTKHDYLVKNNECAVMDLKRLVKGKR